MRFLFTLLLSVSVTQLFAAETLGDIYKCPDGIYRNAFINDSGSRSDDDLLAKGCARITHSNDPISINGNEEVKVKVSSDGHFHLLGQVNGKSISFIVDTGATYVAVSKEFAIGANLTNGKSTAFQTANGSVAGHIFRDVPVMAGGFKVPKVTVANALNGQNPNEGLLGQSFLSNFEVTMDAYQLILRKKKK